MLRDHLLFNLLRSFPQELNLTVYGYRIWGLRPLSIHSPNSASIAKSPSMTDIYMSITFGYGPLSADAINLKFDEVFLPKDVSYKLRYHEKLIPRNLETTIKLKEYTDEGVFVWEFSESSYLTSDFLLFSTISFEETSARIPWLDTTKGMTIVITNKNGKMNMVGLAEPKGYASLEEE